MFEERHWGTASNQPYIRRTPVGERWYYVYPNETTEEPYSETDVTRKPRSASPKVRYSPSLYSNNNDTGDFRQQQLLSLQEQCNELSRERDELQARLNEEAVYKENVKRLTQERNDLLEENEELKCELMDVRSKFVVNNRDLELLKSNQWNEEDRKRLELEFEKEMQAADLEISQLQEERDKLLSERDQLDEALHQAQNDFDELSSQFNLISTREPTQIPPPPQHTAEPTQISANNNLNTSVKVPSQRSPSPHTSVVDVRQSKRGAGALAPPQESGLPWATLSSKPLNTNPNKTGASEICRVLGMKTHVLENVIDPEDGVIKVLEVKPGSLAERAGIRVHDLIEKWNRKVVLSRSDWQEAVTSTEMGSVVRVGVLRQGIRKQVIVTLPSND